MREWLSVMTTGGILEYAPETQTFRLPPEHAACLTRDGRLGNLAVYAQFVALMEQVQERTLECFETGAGLCYHDYPDFHRVMAEDSSQTVVAQLFTELLPLVPGLTARLDAGIDVLDAGCGRGGASSGQGSAEAVADLCGWLAAGPASSAHLRAETGSTSGQAGGLSRPAPGGESNRWCDR
jgi:hypothetical protein